jgi:hypothetical protein
MLGISAGDAVPIVQRVWPGKLTVVCQILDPAKHSVSMFRWVYDSLNDGAWLPRADAPSSIAMDHDAVAASFSRTIEHLMHCDRYPFTFYPRQHIVMLIFI